MGIERTSLEMVNLVKVSELLKIDEWERGINFLKESELYADTYQNGPFLFSIAEVDGQQGSGNFDFYMPVNQVIKILDNDDVTFVSNILVEDAFSLRFVGEDVDFEGRYREIKLLAEENDLKLEKMAYFVLTEIYHGEYIFDIFVPIINGSDEL
ncbi:DUF5085 family protein [Vagococcus sp. BWB3-3]|uniref:DUF5085 family protein n=1 Tax=Vagococcus allomyrinae TaxID=2794353 RepID=A0A940SYJ4_9ENTE|nr:DUF5085 family protein [Vagococcus allomyrinae]MBP1044531.1 DUF5085 family protein [Vagococcus allomyrinae]